MIAKLSNDTNPSPIILDRTRVDDILDNLEILHLRMTRVLLHQASWDKFGLRSQKFLISNEAVIICDILMLVSFRNMKFSEGTPCWLVITGNLRHKRVSLVGLANPS